MDFDVSGGSRDEDMSADTQRRLIAEAVRHSRLPLSDVWMYYFSIGGTAGEYEIEAFLHASYSLPPLQRDMLAHAVNEMIDGLTPPPRAPYSADHETTEPASRALRDIVDEERVDEERKGEGS